MKLVACNILYIHTKIHTSTVQYKPIKYTYKYNIHIRKYTVYTHKSFMNTIVYIFLKHNIQYNTVYSILVYVIPKLEFFPSCNFGRIFYKVK